MYMYNDVNLFFYYVNSRSKIFGKIIGHAATSLTDVVGPRYHVTLIEITNTLDSKNTK